jgi:hypothetical protein
MATALTDAQVIRKIKAYCFGCGLFLAILTGGLAMQAYYLNDFREQNEQLKIDNERLERMIREGSAGG